MSFEANFHTLTGHSPFSWQRRLYDDFFAHGKTPSAVDVPTGLGKTSVMALWLIARAHGAPLPRRLVYVVDRRAVVDQATREAEKLRDNLASDEAAALREGLRLGNGRLPISTLRGQFADNRAWLDDPTAPAIVVGTVDMIGSRLLFEGYGVSRKMRPYHAGFLGVDTLVLLDEAHLVPPFAHLLRAIETDAALWPKDEDDARLVRRLVLLPLSATLRADARRLDRAPFTLEDEREDKAVQKRLRAAKRLVFRELAADPDGQLAQAAFDLATKEPARVVVFCDRREKKKGEPSADGVREALGKLAKKAEAAAPEIETLTGGRRMREREATEKRLTELGFIGARGETKPAVLVATSAGEVGVDLDADHMISDLVAFERMAQRLGRVNRRGERASSEVLVFCHADEPAPKNPKEPTAEEERARLPFRAREALEYLPKLGDGFDASPGALRVLARQSTDRVTKATTPEPLRPALTRALVDAWSLTSLETHEGRPEIAPWLRGWIEEEEPQTTLLWRRWLPVRRAVGEDKPRDPRRYAAEVDKFFEVAPPHASELLEAETRRVLDWLRARATATQNVRRKDDDDLPADNDIVCFALGGRDGFTAYSLSELAKPRDKRQMEALERDIIGHTLVLDARLRGLSDFGALGKDADTPIICADDDSEWSEIIGFRVRAQTGDDDGATTRPRDYRFPKMVDGDGEARESLVVEPLGGGGGEDARSIRTTPQTLDVHQACVETTAHAIAAALALPPHYSEALSLAGRLHDEGKRADRWQRAFNAARDRRDFGLDSELAKTRGPIHQPTLDGYRHEFGSLGRAETDETIRLLSEEHRDLVLHLVAAHHGRARPVIETRGCDDGPPSVLEERARRVALRFARLQKRWGPWGLAWWEALLRAADQKASRENEAGGGDASAR
ncbi:MULTISPECIES: type I-G CRISPR-associated helicase/endonuclease Cas3g [Methylosinus]|nr:MULTISPECIES: type I-U CRISPR-associated helicase/endonuclease Cas3 [Methylosinus]